MAAESSYRYKIDDKGVKNLLEDLAYGFDTFANRVVEQIRALAPSGVGVHPPRGKKEPPIIIHYRDTIHAATWLTGERIAGREVRVNNFTPPKDGIASVVYTTFGPLGHIYELTGAGPHDIPVPLYAGSGRLAGLVIVVHHPGVSRKPHFVPGLFAASSQAGITIRGKVREREGGA